MRERYRILRTLAVPLAILVVFFVIIPKACLPKPGEPKTRTQTTPAVTPSSPAHDDVKVENQTGPNEARIEYLVEVDRHFSTPKLVSIPRKANEVLFDTLQQNVRFSLLQKRYIEATPDGDLIMTREGDMAMGEVLRRRDWEIPVAKRNFLRINRISDGGAGQHDVSFSWKWDLIGIGRDVGPLTPEHGTTARFAGQGHSAVLVEFRSSIEMWP